MNEEESVEGLIESMLNQSKFPDEIVIVDGGSRDGTTKVLEMYQKDHPSLIKIILAPDANIAKGRNIAIPPCECREIVYHTECYYKWIEKIPHVLPVALI